MVAGGHQDLAGSSAGLARPAVRSGMARRRELFGLPSPRQQPLELVRLGPARDHALEHVGQPGQRLDPVEPGGRHQAGHDRPVAGPAVRAGEHLGGLSMNRTAKLLGVSTPSVQAWIERFAEVYAQKPEPEGRAVVVELDEMWHFLKKSRASSGSGRLGIVLRDGSSTGSWGVVTRPPSNECWNA